MSEKYDQFTHVRTTRAEKAAVTAIAKARGMTTGELVREALDAYVIKSGAPLTPEIREQVVEKVVPRLDAQISKEAANAQSALDRAVDGLPEALTGMNERLAQIEDHLANSK